jgi:uncharacterized RDD family membrane protein YckC
MKVKVDDFYTYELASISARWFALFLDNFLLGLVGMLIGLRAGLWTGGSTAIILSVLYNWYFLTQHNGQTPGKMLLGIRVIATNGDERISDINAILRTLGYTLNGIFLGLGWIAALLDRNKQGWHDKLGRTYVINAREKKVDTVYVDGSKSKRKNQESDPIF